MSSRSLAAARARRAGENAPPVSGNRPVTSIGSQAAFSQQMPPGMGYNMPPPPNNVRTARSMQPPPQQYAKQPPQKYQQFYDQQEPQHSNGLPFTKLSISDAIGLITLRLGRVEQWIIDTDQEEVTRQSGTDNMSGIPENHKVIDNSVLTSIINRLDSLEKNGSTSISSEELKTLVEDVKALSDLKTLSEQFKRMSDDVAKHTIELAKNTEQIFRFNRELTETKDILKSFMVKYDMFANETLQSFSDYETALSDLELRLPVQQEQTEMNSEAILEEKEIPIESNTSTTDADGENIIMSVDLKNMIKQELANIS
jgi:hypothetical protein